MRFLRFLSILPLSLASDVFGARLVESWPLPISVSTQSAAAASIGTETTQRPTAVANVSIVEPAFKPPATWAYAPANLVIKVGTTVAWSNDGVVVHTVTSNDDTSFDSKVIAPKASFSFTPKSAGRFAYHCAYHPWMKGMIVVEP